MTAEEIRAKAELDKHIETKSSQLKEIISNEPNIEKAMRKAYNLAISDCAKTARIHCISDHNQISYAIRHFDIDKNTITKNLLPLPE